MSKAEICNTIILIIQSIILLGQLSLSRKIHNSDISKEKGYFIIEETNHKHFDNRFLLLFCKKNECLFLYIQEIQVRH